MSNKPARSNSPKTQPPKLKTTDTDRNKKTATAQKRVLTTGASGFVGRAVLDTLADKAIKVRAMIRNEQDIAHWTARYPDVEWVSGNLNDADSLNRACEGCWGLINLAGLREFWCANREDYYQINEHGARRLFQAALKQDVQKVVQVSTPLAFGMPEQSPFDESAQEGPHASDYARSKFLGDRAGWELHNQQGLPLTVVHLAAVIGAGDDKATMEIERAVKGQLPALVGADTVYTFVYRYDAAKAIVNSLLSEQSTGKRYLIGNQRMSTRDYFNLIASIAGVKAPRINIPERRLLAVARGMERVSRFTGRRPLIPADVLQTTIAGSLLFSAERSERELGMQYTPLSHALREAIEEIRERGPSKAA